MKYFLLILLVLLTFQIAVSEVTFLKKMELENYYDNNILRLSDTDLEIFEDGTDTDKFELESSDDIVTSALLDLGIKHKFAMGHTQINRIVLKYNKYWNNGFKDDGYIRFGLKQYLNRKLNFQLNYYYYPQIYSNYYRSEIDDRYHSYKYSKNVYNANIEWDVLKDITLIYRFELSQLYFSKFFTEYDAGNITNRIDIRFRLLPNLVSTLSYAFKVSDADAEEAYDDINGSIQFKDASYEANLFFIQFLVPKLFAFNNGYAKLRVRSAFEGYYFSSVVPGDDYHLQRDDNIIKIDAGLTVPVQKKMDLELFLKRDARSTESPYSSVEEAKDYCRLRAGFSIVFSF